MRTVFRLVFVLVCAAFIVGCGTYTVTRNVAPPPAPKPPTAPKVELPAPPAAPQPPAAPKVEPPVPPPAPVPPAALMLELSGPPSPVLQHRPLLIRVDGSIRVGSSDMADSSSTTINFTLGDRTYYIVGVDGVWRVVQVPVEVEPLGLNLNINLR